MMRGRAELMLLIVVMVLIAIVQSEVMAPPVLP
jgi:hypothetical protein